jgi:hypothetical protein
LRQKDARLFARGNQEAQQPQKKSHARKRAVASTRESNIDRGEKKEKLKDMDVQK